MSRASDPRTGSTEPWRRHAEPTRRSTTAASWVLIVILLVILAVALGWASGEFELVGGWS